MIMDWPSYEKIDVGHYTVPLNSPDLQSTNSQDVSELLLIDRPHTKFWQQKEWVQLQCEGEKQICRKREKILNLTEINILSYHCSLQRTIECITTTVLIGLSVNPAAKLIQI